jgi:hypothetical protein
MITRASPMSIALIFFAMLSLLGCPAGPTYIVQQYAGPPREKETIGILRVNGKDSVRLAALDDEEITARIAEDTRLHVEVLPGRHTVSVRGGDISQCIAFQVEPGKVYRVVIEGASKEPGSAAGNARIHEVDRDSDAVGRDVTTTPE